MIESGARKNGIMVYNILLYMVTNGVRENDSTAPLVKAAAEDPFAVKKLGSVNDFYFDRTRSRAAAAASDARYDV